MRITVLTGSPRKNGTSALLADRFIAGAREAGHEVFRYDTAFADVKPCIACDYCAAHAACVYPDAMLEIGGQLLCADVVALITPLHYFGFSAQIKAVISRFHAYNAQIKQSKRAILMATSAKDDSWTMSGLDAVYEAMVRYLGWQNLGKLFATGCPTRSAIEKSDFPQTAYQIGKAIR